MLTVDTQEREVISKDNFQEHEEKVSSPWFVAVYTVALTFCNRPTGVLIGYSKWENKNRGSLLDSFCIFILRLDTSWVPG